MKRPSRKPLDLYNIMQKNPNLTKPSRVFLNRRSGVQIPPAPPQVPLFYAPPTDKSTKALAKGNGVRDLFRLPAKNPDSR